jgi:uncharacterized UBP type Zn finger protein
LPLQGNNQGGDVGTLVETRNHCCACHRSKHENSLISIARESKQNCPERVTFLSLKAKEKILIILDLFLMIGHVPPKIVVQPVTTNKIQDRTEP